VIVRMLVIMHGFVALVLRRRWQTWYHRGVRGGATCNSSDGYWFPEIVVLDNGSERIFPRVTYP
jgi:hypothetical protein